MFKLIVVVAISIGGIWLLPGVTVAAADEELMDCRAVDCFQRAACNRRVLAALHALKTTFSEHRAFQSPAVTAREIAIQRERQERLRSFWAPECKPISSKPGASSQTWSPPLFSRPIDLNDVEGRNRMLSRWDGWVTFHNDRSVRLWFLITEMTIGGYVKACSNRGMVMGSVTETGLLQLPWSEALGFDARILLWRSPPYYDDMEGVLLVETEPGREFDSGLVWLSRKLTRADSILPTDYPCQDKEILDRRKQIWNPSAP
jgi:hypothetical protein